MSSFYHAQSGRTIYVGGGIPGRSAYDEAVHLGLFSGSRAEFVAWLQGAPGPEGPEGPAGSEGPAGPGGPPGPPAHFLEPVATEADLPAGAEEGAIVLVEETGRVWVRSGEEWAWSMPWVGPPGSGTPAVIDGGTALGSGDGIVIDGGGA